MKNKKYKIIMILSIAIVALLVIFLNKKEEKKEVDSNIQKQEKKISYMDGVRDIKLAGRINSKEQTKVAAELSSKITKIYVKEGDVVKKGKTLVALENINQRLAVKNAQVSVNSAKLQLQKLQNNNSLDDKNSVLSNVINQQQRSLSFAKNAYLNADIRAYPEDNDETTLSPTVSGNYNCSKEGQYIIDIYGSGSSSGASMKITGLEEDRASVSTDYPVKFGSCGLEIIFPKDFKKNRIWIISVPNTRSAQYVAAKKQYENIVAGKNLAIKKSTVLPEDISAAKDRLAQARLGLELAQTQLSKTRVKAPFEGQVTKLFADVGNLASAYVPLLEMTSPGFEINADISNEFLTQIQIGDISYIEINGKKYDIELKNIIQQSEKGSQKIPLRFEFTNEIPENIFDGMFVEIPFHFEQESVFFIETDFVGFGYNGPFINCDNEENLVNIKNENDKGYWVEFINNSCDGNILLPHFLENN